MSTDDIPQILRFLEFIPLLIWTQYFGMNLSLENNFRRDCIFN